MSVLVAGASLAGLSAAETLRKSGYESEIVVVDRSTTLPVDRPPLSKQILSGEWALERAVSHSHGKLDNWGLDLRLGSAASRLELDPLRVTLEDGSVLEPEGVVIATGSRPRHISDSASRLQGVHVLRDLAHTTALRSDLESSSGPVAVVGAGFIGAEVAATCRSLGHEVTMIEAAATPLVRVLPAPIGQYIAGLHRESGVDVRLGVGVADIVAGPDGHVRGVAMADGSMIEATIVVVGIGVQPNVEWLEGSGLDIANGVTCDARCVASPRVVAAGDVASWHNPRYDRRMRVEQWEHAIGQGEHAAVVLLSEMGFAGSGEVGAFDSVPWFWSDQYDRKIQMAGIPDASDEMVVVEGSIEEGRFAVLFRRGERCSAVLGVNRPRHVMQARMRLEQSLDWDGVISLFD